MGALSATSNEEHVERLGVFGENLGIAFQLQDDYLDYAGRKKLLGKSVGNDLKEKKFTLPLIISLNNAPKKKSAEIMKLIKSDSKKKFDIVHDFVYEYGGMEYTQNKIKEYSLKAKEAICIFKETETKKSLLKLVDFLEIREH